MASFLYEIFPQNLHLPLHVVTGILATTFIANLAENLFWCHPIGTMWNASTTSAYTASGGYCAMKMFTPFNIAQFGGHLPGTILVTMLPIVVFLHLHGTSGMMRTASGERSFALSMLGLEVLSVAASATAFGVERSLEGIAKKLNPASRHAVILSSVVDQNAIFLGACLNVLRVWRGNRSKETAELEMKGLAIEVERR